MTRSMIAEAITAHWGERCDTVDADCPTCQAWAELDWMQEKAEDTPPPTLE